MQSDKYPPNPSSAPFDAEQITRLVRSCHARMGSPLNEGELDEVVQDTCVAAWSQRHSFRRESSVSTWVYGIARLKILRHRRLSLRRRDVDLSLLPEAESPVAAGQSPASVADTSYRRHVQEAIHEEGTTVMSIVEAYSVEGDSFAEIGARLEMSESSVKSRYYRALPSLRTRLGKVLRDSLGRDRG